MKNLWKSEKCSEKEVHSSKTETLTFSIAILMSIMLLASNMELVAATNAASCSTASSPKGVVMDNSVQNIWIGESAAGKLGTASVPSSPTSCSVTSYTAQNDPTHVAFSGGGGSIAFTQKGTGGTTTSCITTFNTVTHSLSHSQCSNGAGFNDVAQDPTSTTVVYASLYYVGKIAKYDTSSGTITYINVPKAAGCTFTPAPEGLRVDSSGNVWVADENCNSIEEYQPSSGGFWSSYLPGYTPYFLDLDNTNNYVWSTSLPYNVILKTSMGSGSTTAVSDQTGETGPFAIAADPADNRVDVTFQNGGSGSVDIYSTSLSGWLCGTAGDVYSGSYPFGIAAESSDYYWATDYNNGKLLVGYC